MQTERYFPELSAVQHQQYRQLIELYQEWNSKINIVSRKDIENLEVHHLLFSLSISRIFKFQPGTRIMDAGTGGGLPGIPLAIYFPQVEFTLVDSVRKKISVVENICRELGLTNVKPRWGRFEEISETFHFITGRAVTALPELVRMIGPRISDEQINDFSNGLLYLKGGELVEELSAFPGKYDIYPLSDFFDEPFFETKKLIHLFDL